MADAAIAAWREKVRCSTPAFAPVAILHTSAPLCVRGYGVLTSAHVCRFESGREAQPGHVQYRVNFWRPTVGIRNERRRFMPDPHWLPYGVPKTNSDLVDATRNPSFPAYPSGHATIGTAAFAAAKAELGVGDDFAFRFQSAEFDGRAQPACENPRGRNGRCAPRPAMTKSLTIGSAIAENEVSRVFLGVHWRMDSTQGGILGDEIGGAVSDAFPGKVGAGK